MQKFWSNLHAPNKACVTVIFGRGRGHASNRGVLAAPRLLRRRPGLSEIGPKGKWDLPTACLKETTGGELRVYRASIRLL